MDNQVAADLIGEADRLMKTCTSPSEIENLIEELSLHQGIFYEDDKTWEDLHYCKYKLLKLLNEMPEPDNGPTSKTNPPPSEASVKKIYNYKDSGPVYFINDAKDLDNINDQDNVINRNGDLTIVSENDEVTTVPYCHLFHPDLRQFFNGFWNWICDPNQLERKDNGPNEQSEAYSNVTKNHSALANDLCNNDNGTTAIGSWPEVTSSKTEATTIGAQAEMTSSTANKDNLKPKEQQLANDSMKQERLWYSLDPSTRRISTNPKNFVNVPKTGNDFQVETDKKQETAVDAQKLEVGHEEIWPSQRDDFVNEKIDVTPRSTEPTKTDDGCTLPTSNDIQRRIAGTFTSWQPEHASQRGFWTLTRHSKPEAGNKNGQKADKQFIEQMIDNHWTPLLSKTGVG